MELQGYLSILRARARLVATITVLTLLVSLGYSFIAKPTYVARSSVFVSVSLGRTSAELSRSFAYAQGLVRSYSQVATEPVVIDPVIQKLGLKTTSAKLARSITVRAPLGTVIIDIAVSQPSASRAADIANAVATQLSSTVVGLFPRTSADALPVTVSTVTPADVPTSPSAPRKRLNLTLGLLIGLLLGSVIAISRDALDVRIRGARDASAQAKVPVIGSVLDESGGGRRFRAPAFLRTPADARELDRQLRTNFQFMRSQRALKSVVFASAMLDGATGLTVSNLAAALGGAGLSVLIIDADVRRPTLAARHGVAETTGLTSALLADGPVTSFIVRSQVSPVWLLPAGPPLHDPRVMLDEAAMQALLAEVTPLFDIVLIKVPPVLRVADGLLLARLSDGVVVVADERAMNRDVLGEEMNAFEIAGADVLGVVLTQAS